MDFADFKNKSLKKTWLMLFLLLTIGCINFFTMPKFFYPGDAYAIKLSAINLLMNKDLGVAFENREKIEDFLIVPGNAFHENKEKRRYYSRWGFINTFFFAIPEIFVEHGEMTINERSIFFHNCFNVVVAMLIAVYLYLISTLYSKSEVSRLIFVFSVIYATFYWNYLRAQSYDIFQIILFLVFYFHFVWYQRNKEFFKATSCFHLGAAYVSLSVLILVKSFYFFVFLGIALYHLFLGAYKRWQPIRLELYFFLAALTASVLVFCASNKVLYGEYFFSKNASHAPYNPAIIPFSVAYYAPRIKEYFFSLSGSLFFHFPILIFSVLGIKEMLKEHKNEYLFILMLFLISFFVLGGFYTRGEWCYGPRFFLFILPLLSLPILIFLDNFIDNVRVDRRIFPNNGHEVTGYSEKFAGRTIGSRREAERTKRSTKSTRTFAPRSGANIKMIRNFAIMVVFCMVNVYAVVLQTQVNSRHFFLRYYLKNIFFHHHNEKINGYLQDSLFGNIACDFNAFMKNRGFYPPLDELTRNLDDHRKKAFKAHAYDQFYKIEVLGSNYYFGL